MRRLAQASWATRGFSSAPDIFNSAISNSAISNSAIKLCDQTLRLAPLCVLAVKARSPESKARKEIEGICLAAFSLHNPLRRYDASHFGGAL